MQHGFLVDTQVNTIINDNPCGSSHSCRTHDSQVMTIKEYYNISISYITLQNSAIPYHHILQKQVRRFYSFLLPIVALGFNASNTELPTWPASMFDHGVI